LIAHEIAHQWFGDSVTESTWSDLWLSEGFATYFAGLFVQRYEAKRRFSVHERRGDDVFAYEKKKLVPIFDRDTENLMELLNANNYQKGAWVLHMLRSNSETTRSSAASGITTSAQESTASTRICARAREASAKTCARSSRVGFTTAAIRSTS
jgi:hypothetical protein